MPCINQAISEAKTNSQNRRLKMGEIVINVDVYRNLHKGCYSIRNRATGLVVPHDEWCDGTHTNSVVVYDAKFVVNKGGRERVKREGVKNVHAFVRGRWTPGKLRFDWRSGRGNPEAVSYNPYKAAAFYSKVDGRLVYGAERVTLSPNGVVARGILE